MCKGKTAANGTNWTEALDAAGIVTTVRSTRTKCKGTGKITVTVRGTVTNDGDINQ